MQILGSRKRDYRTATTVNDIYNKAVSTVLKEVSIVLMLPGIKSTHIELIRDVHKTRVVIIQMHV